MPALWMNVTHDPSKPATTDSNNSATASQPDSDGEIRSDVPGARMAAPTTHVEANRLSRATLDERRNPNPTKHPRQ